MENKTIKQEQVALTKSSKAITENGLYSFELFQHLPTPVLSLSLAFNIVDINFKATELFLWQTQQVIGKNYFELSALNGLATPVLPNFQDILSGMIATTEPTTLQNGQDKQVKISWQIVGLHDRDHQPKGYLFIGEVITEKEVRNADIAMADDISTKTKQRQFKADIINHVSHDLMLPVNSITQLATTLGTNLKRSHHRDYIDSIITAGNVLQGYIDDISSYANNGMSQNKISKEAFDLRTSAEKIIKVYELQAQRKQLKFIVSYPDDVPRYFISDCFILKKLLSNLINNAIQATEQGYVMVSIDCLERYTDKAVLQIKVEDTGFGIAQEKLDKVFDKFNHVNIQSNGQIGGFGFSLSVAKQLVDMLDGEIHINSQAGTGTAVWCTLPLALHKQSFVHNEKEENQHSDINVCVIDDYQLRGTTVLKHLTKSSDSSLLTAKQALELLKAEQKPSYQIIIIDDEINGVSPLDLAVRIRQYPTFSSTMLVLCVETKNKNLIENAMENGFSCVLTKPTKPSELTNIVQNEWVKWHNSHNNSVKKLTKFNINKIKVLLVEDNILAQKISRSMLEDMGCDIDIASTGEEALQFLNKSYDVIFMDIGLPDKDGMQITREIRQMENGYAKIPIIAMTAHVSDCDKTLCFDAGMDDFISKPISYENLQGILEDKVLKRNKSSNNNNNVLLNEYAHEWP